MIVALDQLLWRPVVVWAQKFRVEEGGAVLVQTSWFLNWLRRSPLLASVRRWQGSRHTPCAVRSSTRSGPATLADGTRSVPATLAPVAFVLLLGVLTYGSWKLVQLLWDVPVKDWGETMTAAGVTLIRVLLSTAIGTLWALPAGLAIGLSPRL